MKPSDEVWGALRLGTSGLGWEEIYCKKQKQKKIVNKCTKNKLRSLKISLMLSHILPQDTVFPNGEAELTGPHLTGGSIS